MMSPFDVFEIMPDGQVMWHRAAVNFEEAVRVAQQSAAQTQNAFFVLHQATRQKFFVDANGVQRENPDVENVA
jgi:ABC-type uncharacterized transport system YnjBCD substrate-binding protein